MFRYLTTLSRGDVVMFGEDFDQIESLKPYVVSDRKGDDFLLIPMFDSGDVALVEFQDDPDERVVVKYVREATHLSSIDGESRYV